MVDPFAAVRAAGLIERAGVIEWHSDGTLARVVLSVAGAAPERAPTPEQQDDAEDLLTYGAA